MAVKTALIVDDSKSARIMLGRLVKKYGLSVDPPNKAILNGQLATNINYILRDKVELYNSF